MTFRRLVRCQVCGSTEERHSPVLAKPCKRCGSRMTYAEPHPGDRPVPPDPKPAEVEVAQ